ncbi:MAG: LysR substrate-binding domain-containing protein [Noviherbaspirillum sp.]
MVRTAHGMRPKARAEELWPTVRALLMLLENSIAPSGIDLTKIKATLRIAMADSMATLLLPSLVDAVEEEAPGIRVRTVPLTTREPRPMLVVGDIDVAVGSFPGVLAEIAAGQAEGGSQIRHHRLYSGKYVGVMRRDHPLADTELILENYCAAHHLQVSVSGRARSSVDEVLAKLGHQRITLLTVNQYFTAGKVIAHSDLITILPFHLLAATGMSICWYGRNCHFHFHYRN